MVDEGKVVPVGRCSWSSARWGGARRRGGAASRRAGFAAVGALRDQAAPRRSPEIAQELGITSRGSKGQSHRGESPKRICARSDVWGHTPEAGSEGRREPLRGVRRLIAEHMTKAHREVPPFTGSRMCDFGAIELKQLIPTVLKATAESLRSFPGADARLEARRSSTSSATTSESRSRPEQGSSSRRAWCGQRSLGARLSSRLADAARGGNLKPEIFAARPSPSPVPEARRALPDADREPPEVRF